MKALKKVLALCLAAILLLALSPAAFADTPSGTSATINIADAKEGETYKIYRMFDVLSVDTSVDPAQISYKVTDAWANFFKQGAPGAEFITLSTDGYPTWNAGKTAADFAKAAKTYAANVTATSTETATATGVTFTLPLGYYFVDSSLGAVCNLTSAHQNVTIHEKNGVPTVEKKILEGVEEKTENVAAIGDTVTYQSKVKLTQGTKNIVYHDVMTVGLTFNENSVRLDGEALPGTVTVKKGESVTDGCTFEVEFTQAYLDTLEINTAPNTTGTGALTEKTVTLTYTATINKNAQVDDKDTNTAHLTFGEKGKSAPSTVETSYRAFDLIKFKTKDGKKVFLEKADFSLYKTEACIAGEEINLVKVSDDDSGTVYRVATENEEGAVTKITTGKKLITIKGLDDATYYLKEIAAPRGYNPLTAPVPVDLTKGNLKAVTEGDFYQNLTGVQVENQAGTTLPSTGGVGTTLFYVVGGLLMVCAVVLLVTKKRMEKNA